MADKFHISLRQVRDLMRSRKGDWERVARELAKDTAKCKTATDGGQCTNGNCQKVVSEDELPQMLADGWRFVAALSSGKCVVSNEASEAS